MTVRRSRDCVRGLLATFAIAVGQFTTTDAQAVGARSPNAEPFRLVWSSTAACGNARAFLMELESRTALLREADANEHAITLIVETFRGTTGVRGQLTVRKPDGELAVREVPGANCQEVQSAMALIAALMVDPLAGDPARAAPPIEDEPSPAPPSAAPRGSWGLGLEQRLTAHSAIAPHLAWGQAFGVMLTRQTSEIRPSFGISVHTAQTTVSKPHGSAELDWTAAELTLCPLGLEPGETWDVRACAAIELGRLTGTGFRTASPASQSISWSSAGVELQGRYRLLGPLWLGLESAFTFPFSRERFYLDPEETLYRVPTWGVSFGLGLGLRFF